MQTRKLRMEPFEKVLDTLKFNQLIVGGAYGGKIIKTPKISKQKEFLILKSGKAYEYTDEMEGVILRLCLYKFKSIFEGEDKVGVIAHVGLSSRGVLDSTITTVAEIYSEYVIGGFSDKSVVNTDEYSLLFGTLKKCEGVRLGREIAEILALKYESVGANKIDDDNIPF